jgi:hypothetical protein
MGILVEVEVGVGDSGSTSAMDMEIDMVGLLVRIYNQVCI